MELSKQPMAARVQGALVDVSAVEGGTHVLVTTKDADGELLTLAYPIDMAEQLLPRLLSAAGMARSLSATLPSLPVVEQLVGVQGEPRDGASAQLVFVHTGGYTTYLASVGVIESIIRGLKATVAAVRRGGGKKN